MMPAYLVPIANHLWQTTLFALAVAALTLAFRRNRAAVRHGLWLAASIKFLVPFSVLVGLGSQLHWRSVPAVPETGIPAVIEKINEPFVAPAAPIAKLATSAAGPDRSPYLLAGIWFCGFAVCMFGWVREWRRVQQAVRRTTPLNLDIPIRAVSSDGPLEPGVFGILRPVLFLPDNIRDRLSETQLRAIVAHEMVHVRRRDNLVCAVHMLVETIFWFHPLVWWIERRLLEEQERACDEAVLDDGIESEVYAEGILNVCRFYIGSGAACVSRATGADLKRRIAAIACRRVGEPLELGKRVLLAVCGIFTLLLPLAFGLLDASRINAQSRTRTAKFEVASIKFSHDGLPALFGRSFSLGGRFTASNQPAALLLELAYFGRVKNGSRVSGAPDWVYREPLNIEAKAEDGVILPGSSERDRLAALQSMLRGMFADHMNLAAHVGAKEMPVFELTVAKNGPKLRRPEARDCNNPNLNCHAAIVGLRMGIEGRTASMEDLADGLSFFVGRNVIDKTAIRGDFDFDVPAGFRRPDDLSTGAGEERTEAGVHVDSTSPDILTAIKVLGLELKPAKGMVDVLVVDHIERPKVE